MWFGILTPGGHPSRPTAIGEATVLAWTPEDRRRIDGPVAAVHGGLRVLRRMFYDKGLTPCPPRCFVCLRACPVPDPDAIGVLEDVAEVPAASGLAQVWPRCTKAGPAPRQPGTAMLAFVHLAELDGPEETPLDEEVLVVLAGTTIALLTPLDRVPDTLGLLATVALAPVSAPCSRCGTPLPGSDAQRRLHEAGFNRRQRRSHGRRAA